MTRAALIASADQLGGGPRQEPLTVTALRGQMRRGASDAVLFRIAGSEAEFRRLVLEYQLQPAHPLPPAAVPNAVRPPVKDANALSSRQALLLQLAEQTARDGDVWPPVLEIAALLECSWLVVERDIGRLARKGYIRVGAYRCNGRLVRRVELLALGIATALPPPERVGTLKTKSGRHE